jgi:hypothetical protein
MAYKSTQLHQLIKEFSVKIKEHWNNYCLVETKVNQIQISEVIWVMPLIM